MKNSIVSQVYRSIYNYRLDMLSCKNLKDCINKMIEIDMENINHQLDCGDELCLYELDKIITEQDGKKDNKKYQLWINDDTTCEENYMVLSNDTLQGVLDECKKFIKRLESYLIKREEYNDSDANVINFEEEIGIEINRFEYNRLNAISDVIYTSVVHYDRELSDGSIEHHRIGLDVRQLL